MDELSSGFAAGTAVSFSPSRTGWKQRTARRREYGSGKDTIDFIDAELSRRRD
jgi:hypothetical protein